MRVEKIILHHSLTADGLTVSWSTIRRYHLSLGWRDIGYHFGIEQVDRDIEILLGRFENQYGAHTKGLNRNSLGVCFLGNFDLEAPPAAKWSKGLALVRSLLSRYELSREAVCGHRDFAPYKSCPGTLFEMERFRNEL